MAAFVFGVLTAAAWFALFAFRMTGALQFAEEWRVLFLVESGLCCATATAALGYCAGRPHLVRLGLFVVALTAAFGSVPVRWINGGVQDILRPGLAAGTAVFVVLAWYEPAGGTGLTWIERRVVGVAASAVGLGLRLGSVVLGSAGPALRAVPARLGWGVPGSWDAGSPRPGRSPYRHTLYGASSWKARKPRSSSPR